MSEQTHTHIVLASARSVETFFSPHRQYCRLVTPTAVVPTCPQTGGLWDLRFFIAAGLTLWAPLNLSSELSLRHLGMCLCVYVCVRVHVFSPSTVLDGMQVSFWFQELFYLLYSSNIQGVCGVMFAGTSMMEWIIFIIIIIILKENQNKTKKCMVLPNFQRILKWESNENWHSKCQGKHMQREYLDS